MPTTGLQANFGFAANIMIKPNYLNPPAGTIPIYRFRSNTFGLQVRQEITFPPLIDGMIDRSAYQLAAQLVDGDVGFPLVHEGSALSQVGSDTALCGNSTETSLVQELWRFAAERDENGRMANWLDIAAVYPDSTAFLYPGCYVNTATFSVREQGAVDVRFNVIGGKEGVGRRLLNQTDGFNTDTNTAYPSFLSPARIVTWNDVVVAIWQMDEEDYTFSKVLDGTGFREFTVTINNNIDRFYTLNGRLAPQDVAARKRAINGTIRVLGRNEWLNNFAIGDGITEGSGNESRFTSHEYISFGYQLGAAGGIYWATALHGVVFRPEEMTLSPDEVFETTINFEAAGDCKMDYEATRLGTNLSANGTVTTLPEPSGTNYGDRTRDSADPGTFKSAYPSFPSGFNGWEYVP